MLVHKLKFFLLFASSILLPSCITVGVFPLVENLEKFDRNCSLDLFWGQEQVDSPKEDLCEITAVVPHYPWKDHVLGEALDQAYPLACKCGGDGIYIHEMGKGVLKVTAFHYQPKKEPTSKHKDIKQFKSRLLCSEQGKNAYWENGSCTVREDDSRPINMRQRAK